ncbi:hypothetical protein HYDPIDRAFT_184629 [Hydnomerulius pinastri MD-312]|nr:hypothetical protein HYDPIDRAFT_184629 [Hydnomerulius pinastri MD-312]
MATQASRTVPSSPNPSAQASPRTRDWGTLRSGEPGSAFRGMTRGRGTTRGGGSARGGRGGGRPPSSSGQRGGKAPTATAESHVSQPNAPQSKKEAPVARKASVPAPSTAQPNGTSDKAANGSAERGGRPKPGSRRPSRAVPAVVVAPASPTPSVAQTAPSTPSRSANRRRRPQPPAKGPPASNSKPPLPQAVKMQKSRSGSTPASQVSMRKDIPPHLAAAHDAEIRHDIDALVERVRAVAMADSHRPTTPGSHIDWAGDDDDSLPDLDDWGVTTTHTHASNHVEQTEEISPILADTLKPLPEPQSEVDHEDEQEMETYEHHPDEDYSEEAPEPSPLPSSGSAQEETLATPTLEISSEQGVTDPAAAEFSSEPAQSSGKAPLHPSLPAKPVAALESLRARSQSVSKPANLPAKPAPLATDDEPLTSKTEGLSDSIHAPSAAGLAAMERASNSSSSDQGLAASIHAPKPGLPESHSAPSLLNTQPPSSTSRTHSRSQTEGRLGSQQPHTAPANMASHRFSRSGASSPLGRHVYTHSRNHSTPPAGGAGQRPPQASRPVITGEAISRLARTIGGLGSVARATSIPATKDSTITS